MSFSVFLLIAVVLLVVFSLFPLINYLEEKEIREYRKNEKIVLKVKEHTGKKKTILFVAIGVAVFFLVNPAETTLAFAFVKVLLLLSIYLIDDFMKTKFYLTTHSVYVIEHFRHKNMIFAKELTKRSLFRVRRVDPLTEVYEMGYYGQRDLATTVTVDLRKQTDVELFERKLSMTLGTVVSRKTEGSFATIEPHGSIIDRITKWCLWSMFAVSAYGVVQAFTESGSTLGFLPRLLTSIFTLWFIPFALYFFAYFFLRAKNYMKQHPMNWKRLSLIMVIACSTISFIPFMNHVSIQGDRFFKVQLVGIICFALIIGAGWTLGKLSVRWQQKYQFRTRNPF